MSSASIWALTGKITKKVYNEGIKNGYRRLYEYAVRKVVHLGGLLQFGCENDPLKAIEVNVVGTTNVAKACERSGVSKIVFASSGAVYGPQVDVIDEDCPVLPNVSLYGATKFLGEVFLECFERHFHIPYIALRYWGIYGPGEVRSPGMADVFKKIESTILGEDVVIEDVGAEECRHFTFVKDAAQATVKALQVEDNVHKVFNVAGGEDSYTTFKDFHSIIKEKVPSAGEVRFKGAGQDRGRVDITRVREELGYNPEYSLQQGIEEDIKFLLQED